MNSKGVAIRRCQRWCRRALQTSLNATAARMSKKFFCGKSVVAYVPTPANRSALRICLELVRALRWSTSFRTHCVLRTALVTRPFARSTRIATSSAVVPRLMPTTVRASGSRSSRGSSSSRVVRQAKTQTVSKRQEWNRDFGDFVDRQLNDTRYASVLAANYVGLLYGGQIDVTRKSRVCVSAGGATAIVRRKLGIEGYSVAARRIGKTIATMRSMQLPLRSLDRAR